MKVFVLDANAVIRYLELSSDWQRLRTLLIRAGDDEVRLYVSIVNWGEVIYTIAKKVGLARAITDIKTLGSVLTTVSADERETEAAATLKFHYKLGYADSFAAALAMRLNATLVTADPGLPGWERS